MATTLPEAVQPPQRLAFKSAVAEAEVEAPGTVEVRADEGIVEAIVSVTGIEDEVQDVIVPGAYAKTLTRRRPKVIWHHSWEQPIGRILNIEELKPGDPRLPNQTKDGQAWPNKAGGLLATMQFNLKSDRGREAFEAVRFYSESGECEWSIGYQVPPSAATRDKKGVRHIKAIDLYEISFVLFGAASQTGTLGVKAAAQAARARRSSVDVEVKRAGADNVDSMPEGDDVADNGPNPPYRHPVKPPSHDTDTDDGDDASVDGDVASALATLVAESEDEDWTEIEADYLDDDDRLYVEHLAGPEGKAITPGGRVGDDSPVGTPGGKQNWLDQTGGLPRYMRMVAHALIRKGFSKSRAIATAKATMEKWKRGGGNVSPKVQAAATKALAEWNAKRAAAKAIPNKKDVGFAPGGVHWTAQQRAVQVKADQWDPWLESGRYAATKTMTPTSHLEFPKVEGTFEERIEAVRAAVVAALHDTYEAANTDVGQGGDGTQPVKSEEDPGTWSHISIDGTWPDRVIATCIKWSDGADKRKSYEMNYVIADDGEVTLTEPEEVKLTVVAEAVDGDEAADPELPVGDLLPVPEMVESAAAGAKALLLAATEQKAGRVLSGVNESRLKGALESLIAVLRAAGIDIDAGQGPRRVTPAQPDATTTAPSARGEKVLTRDQVTADLAALLDG